MSREKMIKTARASVEAYNEKDWKAARQVLHPGIVYDEVSTNMKVEGVEDVLAAWRGWGKAFPDSRATFGEPVADGDFVVLPLRWRGTHSGPLSLPTGEILPSGEKIDVRACQLIRVDGDKVREVRHYFDMMTLLTQIGEAPAREPAAKARVEKKPTRG